MFRIALGSRFCLRGRRRHFLDRLAVPAVALALATGCAEETLLFPAQIVSTALLKCECGLVTAFREGDGKVPFICERPRAQNVGQFITRLNEQNECVIHQITDADVAAADQYDATGGQAGRLLCGTAECPVRDANNQTIAMNFLHPNDEQRWADALDQCLFLETGLNCFSMLDDSVGPPSSPTWISKEAKCAQLCASRSRRIEVAQCDARALGVGIGACDTNLDRRIQVDIQCGPVTRATKEPNQCVGQMAQPDPPLILLSVDASASTANIVDDDGDSLATTAVSGTLLVSRDRCQDVLCPFQILNAVLEVADFRIRDEVSRQNAIAFAQPITGTLWRNGNLLFIGSTTEVWVRGTLDRDGIPREGAFQLLPFAFGGIDDQAGRMWLTLSFQNPDLELGAILSLRANFISRPPRPAFTAPATAACVDGGAYVTVDASATFDPDGPSDLIRLEWRVDGTPTRVDTAGRVFIPPGPRTLSLVARDRNNLRAEARAAIEVEDRIPPRATCPSPIVTECTKDGAALVDLPDAVATDNCGIASLTARGPRGYPLGTTSLPYTAVDHHGHSDTCVSSVTVVDTRPPAFDLGENASICVLLKPQKEKFAVLRVDRDFERLRIEDACDPGPKLGILGATDLATNKKDSIDLVAEREHVCVETRPRGRFALQLAARDRSGNVAERSVPVKTLELSPIYECKKVDPAATSTVTLAGRPVSLRGGLSSPDASGGRTLAVEFSAPVLVRSVQAEDKDRNALQPRAQGYDARGTLVSTLDTATRDSLSLKELVARDRAIQKLEVSLPDQGAVTTVTVCAPTYDRGAAISGQQCGIVIEAREFVVDGHPECKSQPTGLPR